MKLHIHQLLTLLTCVCCAAILASSSQADPLTGRDLLKFSQQPMNTTTIVNTAGIGNVYQGHDEPSTAYGFNNAAFPAITQYDGTFMADDFADKITSPVIHVKWWGSYHNNIVDPAAPANKFLIAFESDVPAVTPGFSTPGQVLQADVVNRALSISGPGSGEFTEKAIRGPDPILNETLYEYNAELHVNSAFFEQKNTVYWLKISALIDVPGGIQSFPAPYTVLSPPPTMTQWGWHNRDYTIQDTLASSLVSPGETVSTNPLDGASVWHFQDDAVAGQLSYSTIPGTTNFGINQPPTSFVATKYVGNGIDGPSIPGQINSGISGFSKDLAFNLYTFNPQVPEPSTCLLFACGSLGVALAHRRRRG